MRWFRVVCVRFVAILCSALTFNIEGKMSGNKKNPSSVPDEKLEEKFYESTTVDSGFISGNNLTVSGEIRSEEGTTEEPIQENYMRLDSGVDLSESFSGLNLKSPELNDLSKSKKTIPEPPVAEEQDNDNLWKQYFQQDEDGDT